ncbi:MAG TPA: phosphoribosylformylglycinamidine cyclo-ligase [Actinomycetota bacterium]|nr:phosphoribosylformylglycinamidine cyclo-ligase [Actinomycetota bacterium]
MSSRYRQAGVDLDAAAKIVDLVRELASSATRPEVVEGIGGFAGLFKIGDGRLLAAATDGVGTKTEIARMAGRLDTVGIDLVAMCANDVVCTGAEPILFLDYLAVGRLVPDEVAALVRGIVEGCRLAGCALLGGETAEHPGLMEKDRLDMAGFCVGIVEEAALLGPSRVGEGDALLGLPSSGLHANGFSLVRMAVRDAGLDLTDTPKGLGRPLGDELLEPTSIYVPAVLVASRRELVHSAAHITGGGIPENLPRALPRGLGAELDRSAWEVPEVFRFVAELSHSDEEEMFRTFNMGLGMVLAVPEEGVADVIEVIRGAGSDAVPIGRVVTGQGVRLT